MNVLGSYLIYNFGDFDFIFPLPPSLKHLLACLYPLYMYHRLTLS
jgi:hypothetical protein